MTYNATATCTVYLKNNEIILISLSETQTGSSDNSINDAMRNAQYKAYNIALEKAKTQFVDVLYDKIDIICNSNGSNPNSITVLNCIC
jgi:hypothetical protein